MPTSLSIKNVPDDLAERLRRRARRNHRSLQGELLAILHESEERPKRVTLSDVWESGKALGIQTPDESVEMIRADRDDADR